MKLVLPVIDNLAWCLIRVAGLMVNLIAVTILHFYHPRPTEPSESDDFMILEGMLYGGLMLSHAQSPEEVPKPVADRAIVAGRMVLGIVIIEIVQKGLKLLVG